MTTLEIIFSAVGSVVLIIVAAAVISSAVSSSRLKKGTFGISAIKKVFSGAKFKDGTVISPVRLDYNGKKISFENAFVSPYGLILTDTFSENGDYYGSGNDERWVKVINDTERDYLPNFHRRGEEYIVSLRELFSKNNIYKVPVEYYIVKTRTGKKINFYINSCPDLIGIKEFKRLVSKSKYSEDNGVNVEKIKAVFEKYSI